MDINFKIFDEDKETYNLGDLLNMPSFWANWKRTPHNDDNHYSTFKRTALQYKNNILGIYDAYRIDDCDPIPNIELLRLSVDTYIKNNKDCIDNQMQTLCDSNNTLFVHLRAGDMGIVENEFIDIILKVSSCYQKIVILCGIHKISGVSSEYVLKSIHNTKISLSKISKKRNIIININEPDYHLSVMRKCKNLLVHRGGFSMLGGLLFTGKNLFITKFFNPKTDDYFKYIEHYIKVK